MKTEPATEAALKITMQYRSGQGKVYELERAGVTLDVHVSPSSTPDHGEWLVEAQSSRAQDAVVISERGATAALALREVARTWTASARDRNLPVFDWDAVATVLSAVRAI